MPRQQSRTKAERQRIQDERIAAYARDVVDSAPEPTDAQLARIRELLRPHTLVCTRQAVKRPSGVGEAVKRP
jgi:lactate dehydrogenase-like 2-hydroxyacid dehydrogenase